MAKKIRVSLEVKDKGSQKVKKFAKTTKSEFNSLSSVAKKLAGPLALGAIATAFAASIKKTIDYADKLHKLNLRLGVSVKEMDKLKGVAELSAVTFETLAMAMQRMTRRVADAADAGGPAATALEELGLNAEHLMNLRPDEQFKIIAERLETVDSQTKKVSLAFKLFDSEGVSVLQMTKGLNTQLERMTSNMSQDKASAAAKFKDTMTSFSRSIEQLTITFLPKLTTALVWLMKHANIKLALTDEEQIASLGKWRKELKKVAKEIAFFNSLSEGAKDMILDEDSDRIEDLIEKQKKLTAAIRTARKAMRSAAKATETKEAIKADRIAAVASKTALEKFLEVQQKKCDLVKEFAEIYKQSTMTTYAYEILQIEKVAVKYKEAGANEVKVAEWAAQEIATINEQATLDLETELIKKDTAVESSFKQWISSAKSWGESIDEIGTYALDTFGSGFIDAVASADESFEDFAEKFLIGIGKMIAKQLILNSLQGLFGMFGGSGSGIGTYSGAPGGGYLAAKGGVFPGGLEAFQNGGIVRKPTMFKFAGGAGLMGEAGAEAIMPLKRSPSGNLGVEANGGNQPQQVNYNIKIDTLDPIAYDDFVKRNPGAIIGVFNQEIERGNASLNQNIRKVAQ